MSARTVEASEGEPEGQISRAEALACDEALQGLEAAEFAELAELTNPSAGFRGELQLVAARLSLRNLPREESLPTALRAKVQAQAFEHFDGVVKPKSPTATTTGANVVELDSNVVELQPRRSRWVAVAAAAALLLTVSGSALVRPSPTPATAPQEQRAEQVLRGSNDRAQAELRVGEKAVQLEVVSEHGLEKVTGQHLWLRVAAPSGEHWLKVSELPQASGGRVEMAVELKTSETVLGFAVAAPSSKDASLPAVESALVLGMVNE